MTKDAVSLQITTDSAEVADRSSSGNNQTGGALRSARKLMKATIASAAKTRAARLNFRLLVPIISDGIVAMPDPF
jgi:hypothetical protein